MDGPNTHSHQHPLLKTTSEEPAVILSQYQRRSKIRQLRRLRIGGVVAWFTIGDLQPSALAALEAERLGPGHSRLVAGLHLTAKQLLDSSKDQTAFGSVDYLAKRRLLEPVANQISLLA